MKSHTRRITHLVNPLCNIVHLFILLMWEWYRHAAETSGLGFISMEMGPVTCAGGVGYYVNAQKTRITGTRLAPPKRDVGAYYAEKREQKEFPDPVKPGGPSRRTFADHTYRRERAKSKTRDRIPSAERASARGIRRMERELRGREVLRKLRQPKEPEVIPDNLRPTQGSKVTQDARPNQKSSHPATSSAPKKHPLPRHGPHHRRNVHRRRHQWGPRSADPRSDNPNAEGQGER